MKKNFLWKKISYGLILAMLFTGMYIPVYALDFDASEKATTQGETKGTGETTTEETITEVGKNEAFSYGPYFDKDEHVHYQCEYVIKNLGLTQEQGNLLKETCMAADSSFGTVRGLHARKNAEGASNYLANLKALFLSAQLIDEVDSLEDAVLSRMPKISAKDKADVREVIRVIKEYISEKNYHQNKNYI